MVDELKKAGGDVLFTVYPGLGHNICKQTYENEELYKWFLKHKKKR
jgi:dipeptidyl aminopeptidase/acylaminoacyl peptidase